MKRINCVGCEHKRVVLIGNEEVGLKRLVCEDCRVLLTRRAVAGEYVYLPLPGRPTVDRQLIR